MGTFELLAQLSEAPGPTGGEAAVAAIILEQWQPLTDSATVDRVGSVRAIKRGTLATSLEQPPRLLLAAHLDEIGLIVARIEEYEGNGFIRVTNVGGVDRRQLLGQQVTVMGRQALTGVLGGLPNHLLPVTDRSQAYTYENLVVDVGLPFNIVKENVDIGDFVVFRQPLRKLNGSRVSGKALDNRASVLSVTLCLQQLQTRTHQWDIVAAATSQEETTFLGAYTSAYVERPDIAIAIDVTHGKGPGVSSHEGFELGGGPVIGFGGNVHPGVTAALQEAAKALEMQVEIDPHAAGSGTDAYALQTSREGIPTGLVELPLRYMHTMVETMDTVDIERAGRLLAEFSVRLDEQFLPALTEELMRPHKEKN